MGIKRMYYVPTVPSTPHKHSYMSFEQHCSRWKRVPKHPASNSILTINDDIIIVTNVCFAAAILGQS